ncbi:hypothetical protein A3C20_01890 [Candidatus Kaiserbacteria bacterium RIFCSPHIGHO2_02_FULL_55_25]|uniref:Uncharacterized protein n=1 Tax=Candidatus Kaiserbacteria bacterium RIFCSPHIGHO2_02_FULL_55_25 TaxID=1798498 RepID=A0A1F6E435_9BACT|nr:MAG: hypothetical protein A2764_00155 [Candidatus Kaiserbacteria bacterium RIFCSPHIGHO2_01_FULL_55_79]OGG68465.1 MAG: hypothetical protein A3C20_01890 [Candidatus Kaiserbacteria bacterium RIFCSPHIGHO2_02_FULL_55_25]OGG78403.1 MAG: hypothetical protein A3F56_03170 [Candidatus Kaiserbacteria bacterium RIFCSPHIGHO2_12_FULL_55_13]OGG82749.1 MAG: hypothetical protein A3A42_02695 [Candidatus Kaiserbacteria bacterium RIFCSPLOWO2_01_FULL_55_25]
MREYLERHLEPLSNRDDDQSSETWLHSFPESIRRELLPELKFDDSGTETVKLPGGGTLAFSYEPVPVDAIEEYRKIYGEISPSDLMEGYEHLASETMVVKLREKCRKLTSLSIQTSFGKSIQLAGLPVRHVLFSTDDTWIRSSYAERYTKDVLLYCPPTSILSLLILFHEIGHLECEKQLTKREVARRSRARGKYQGEIGVHPIFTGKARVEGFEEVSELVLREERDAWAVALSKLRHVMPAFDVRREDVLKSIHEITLSGYSDAIRKRMGREPSVYKMLDTLSTMLKGILDTRQKTTAEKLT